MRSLGIQLFYFTALICREVESFSVVPLVGQVSSSSTTCYDSRPFFADETDNSDNKSRTSTSSSTIYDRLGISEDQIAIGVDANEVLQWLGNKEDIIAKFMKDNKSMTKEIAETEVGKFMMDAEMVRAFVEYEKKKSDPKFYREDAERRLSDPSTWATYAIWITAGAGFAYVKNVIVEPKYASGEWQEIHITLPGANFGSSVSTDMVSTVMDSVSSTPALDAPASSVVEVITQNM